MWSYWVTEKTRGVKSLVNPEIALFISDVVFCPFMRPKQVQLLCFEYFWRAETEKVKAVARMRR